MPATPTRLPAAPPLRSPLSLDGLLSRGWDALSTDSQVKTAIVLSMLAVNLVLLHQLNLRFPAGDAIQPVLFAVVLGGVAWFYRCVRPVPQFATCAGALLQLIVFSSAFTVLMYAIAATAAPLADAQLAGVDRALGVHVPALMAAVAEHPALRVVLHLAYDTLLPQTALVIMILGLAGDRLPLERFMLTFMTAALITALLFLLLPAAGPFRAYGFEPSATQARYLAHFDALREGTLTVATWRHAEGLITFPSFHTAWAILLTLALQHRPRLLIASAVLNTLVIVSTMTTGWHYFADVIGGMGVALLAIGVVRWASPWCYRLPARRPVRFSEWAKLPLSELRALR